MSALEILENYISLAKKEDIPFHSRVGAKNIFLLFEWMYEVSSVFHLLPRTYHLATAIIRKLVTFYDISLDHLQGYGVMTMHLSEFLNENNKKTIKDYMYICDGTYTYDELKKFHVDIFEKLNGEIFIPTVDSFRRLYFMLGAYKKDGKRQGIKEIFALLAMDIDSYYYSYHELAILSIFLIRLIDGEETIKLVFGEREYFCSTTELDKHNNLISKVHDVSKIIEKIINQLTGSKKLFNVIEDLLPKFKQIFSNLRMELTINKQAPQKKIPSLVIHKRFTINPIDGEEIGRGRYSKVVKVTIGESTFAVKIQNNDYFWEAIKEIAIMRTLSHDNVQKIDSFRFTNHEVYFSMSLQLCSLDDFINRSREGKYDWEDVFINQIRIPCSIPNTTKRTIGEGILKGLAYIHSYGIIHSDVKPKNILLSSDNTVKITDFGISKLYVAGENDFSRRTLIASTGYKSPESIQAAIDYTPIVCSIGEDIWSLGVTLLALEMEQTPFMSVYHHRESLEKIDKIVKEMKLSMVKDLVLKKLLIQMLRYDETERISARQALSAWSA